MLLSIPALVAMDAVVFVKERKMELRALGVELPLLETRTKHLALRVCFDPQAGIATDVSGSQMAHSINDDLFVYYGEEATFPVLFEEPAVICNDDEAAGDRAFCPQFGPRGVRKDDEILGVWVNTVLLSWPMPLTRSRNRMIALGQLWESTTNAQNAPAASPCCLIFSASRRAAGSCSAAAVSDIRDLFSTIRSSHHCCTTIPLPNPLP